jgi:prephenate dehydratase
VGHIVDEAFVRVHINLLASQGHQPDPVRRRSCCDPSQCGKILANHGIACHQFLTARVKLRMWPLVMTWTAALASEMAAKIYELDILAHHIEDHDRNMVIMSRDPDLNRRGHGMVGLSSACAIFLPRFTRRWWICDQWRQYDQAGKLYGRRAVHAATQFTLRSKAESDDRTFNAMDELDYFTDHIRLMGVFPAAPRRHESKVQPKKRVSAAFAARHNGFKRS